MFLLILGRKKELVDYDWIGWGIKFVGEYLTHKLLKMAKGKIVDEKVLKWKKNNCFLKIRESNNQ